MKNPLFSTLIILMALLSACGPQSAVQPTAMTSSAATSPSITVAAVLPGPTIAAVSKTPTATPANVTETPTANGDAVIVPTEECINLEPKLPDDLALSGVWAINQGSPFLENLANHKDYPVPLFGRGALDTNEGDFAISPDNTKMAYIDKYYGPVYYREEKRILRVMNSSGKSMDMSFWKEDWQWIIGWVDNQNLAVATSGNDVVILNPAKGSMRTFVQPLWAWEKIKANKQDYYSPNIPASSYSPNLEWFFDRKTLELINVRTGETINKLDGVGIAAWSADSTTLAIIWNNSSNNSIVILRDGKQDASFDTLGTRADYYEQPKLSPDNKKMAFNSSENNKRQLTVLDIAQHKLSRVCADGYGPGFDSPSWSPDGRFVVELVYDQKTYQAYTLLVDIRSMRAYLLHTSYSQDLFAWLSEP